ncbi:hypothetical protein TUBRATIS_009820, partial [Tubulinosema ratisbonensis]
SPEKGFQFYSLAEQENSKCRFVVVCDVKMLLKLEGIFNDSLRRLNDENTKRFLKLMSNEDHFRRKLKDDRISEFLDELKNKGTKQYTKVSRNESEMDVLITLCEKDKAKFESLIPENVSILNQMTSSVSDIPYNLTDDFKSSSDTITAPDSVKLIEIANDQLYDFVKERVENLNNWVYNLDLVMLKCDQLHCIGRARIEEHHSYFIPSKTPTHTPESDCLLKEKSQDAFLQHEEAKIHEMSKFDSMYEEEVALKAQESISEEFRTTKKETEKPREVNVLRSSQLLSPLKITGEDNDTNKTTTEEDIKVKVATAESLTEDSTVCDTMKQEVKSKDDVQSSLKNEPNPHKIYEEALLLFEKISNLTPPLGPRVVSNIIKEFKRLHDQNKKSSHRKIPENSSVFSAIDEALRNIFIWIENNQNN